MHTRACLFSIPDQGRLKSGPSFANQGAHAVLQNAQHCQKLIFLVYHNMIHAGGVIIQNVVLFYQLHSLAIWKLRNNTQLSTLVILETTVLGFKQTLCFLPFLFQLLLFCVFLPVMKSTSQTTYRDAYIEFLTFYQHSEIDYSMF